MTSTFLKSMVISLCFFAFSSVAIAQGAFQVKDAKYNTNGLSINGVSVVFSAPVKVEPSVVPGTFDPPLSGFWTVATEDKSGATLRFATSQTLAPCTAYTISFNGKLASRAGALLGDGVKRSFVSSVLSVTGTEYADKNDGELSVKFSHHVLPTDVAKYMKITDESGAALAWTVANSLPVPARTVTVKLAKPPTKAKLKYDIQAGLIASGGNNATKGAITGTIQILPEFVVQSVRSSYNKDSGVALRVELSQKPSATVKLDECISVNPAVKFTPVVDGSAIMLYGDFQCATAYAVTLKNLFATRVGITSAMNPAVVTLSIATAPEPIILGVKSGSGILSTKGSMVLPIRAQGISKPLDVTVYKLYDNNYSVFRSGYDYNDGVVSWGEQLGTLQVPVVRGNAEVDLRGMFGTRTSGTYRIDVAGSTNGVSDNVYTFGEESDELNEEYISNYDSDPKARVSALVTLSDLALIAKYGEGTALVWAGELHTALPKQGVAIEILSDKNQKLTAGMTDADGFVRFTGLPSTGLESLLALARSGDEIAYLEFKETQTWSQNFPYKGSSFVPKDGLFAYVTAERGAYRPGEAIQIIALLREKQGTAKGNIPVMLRLTDPSGSTVYNETFVVDGEGRLEKEIAVAAEMPTGFYTVMLSIPSDSAAAIKKFAGSDGSRQQLGECEVFIGDFIPNRLRVSADTPKSRIAAGQSFDVNATVEEMFGAPAAGREVEFTTRFSGTNFAPKEFEKFRFCALEFEAWNPNAQHDEAVGLDENGKATATVEFPADAPARPLTASVTVGAADGGRVVSAKDSVTLDTADFYIGAKTENEGFVKLNTPQKLEFVAVNPMDKTLVVPPAQATYTVCKEQWNNALKKTGNGYQYEASLELIPVTSGTLTFGAEGPAQAEVTLQVAGAYRVQVETKDKSNRKVYTELQFTASSGEWGASQAWSMKEPESVQVTTDKASYLPGETARVLIKAPFAGTAIVGFEQDFPLRAITQRMETNTLEIPIEVPEDFAPMTHVSVTVVRAVTPSANWLPHRAVGFGTIRLADDYKKIDVELQVPDVVLPGTDVAVKATLKDTMTSSPLAGANVRIWGVDEGVLTLTSFKLANPLSVMFREYSLQSMTADLYGRLAKDTTVRDPKAQGGDGEGGNKFINVVSKQRVKPVVTRMATLKTDADGVVHGNLQGIPDSFNGSLTIMAVADSPKLLGSATADVTVRGPLVVQNNAPRFLALGDKAIISYTLFNNTDTAAVANLTFTADNAVAYQDATLETAPIPAGGSISVETQVTAAADKLGESTLRCSATLGNYTATDTVALAVREIAPRKSWTGIEKVATDDSTANIDLCPIGEILPESLNVTVSTAAFGPAQLQNAVRWNLEYPYGCLEQTISRALPLIAVEQAELSESLGYSPQFIRQTVKGSLDRLPLYSSTSGEYNLWPSSGSQTDGNMFINAYTLMFLCVAREAGYAVRAQDIDMATQSLRWKLMSDSKDESLDALALANYALTCAERGVADVQEKLLNKVDELSPSALGWLVTTLHRQGQVQLRDKYMPMLLKVAVAGVVSAPTETTGENASYSEPTRDLAVALCAILFCRDASKNMPAEVDVIVAQLSKAQLNGSWTTTQNNAWAVMAMAMYNAQTAGREKPEFTGTVTADDKETTFTEAIAAVVKTKSAALTINATGKGEAAVTWSASAIPMGAQPSVSSGGLSVKKRLLDRNGKALDVSKIKVKDLIIVELQLKSARYVTNLVVQDLLPACFEIEDARLATAESIPEAEREVADNCWSEQYSDPRDDRMLTFGSLEATTKADKVGVIRYTVRAVTPGTFTMPSVQAEDMYNPQTVASEAGGAIMVSTVSE